jgi:hypothetical protein
MVEKKHLLKLSLISVAAITAGAVIGLVLNYQAIKEARLEESTPPLEETEEPKIATYSGTIKPLEASIYMEGTHFLEDGAGKIITLLKSRKIDLTFLEGQAVEVEGKLSEAVEGGQTILEVEKVRF